MLQNLRLLISSFFVVLGPVLVPPLVVRVDIYTLVFSTVSTINSSSFLFL